MTALASAPPASVSRTDLIAAGQSLTPLTPYFSTSSSPSTAPDRSSVLPRGIEVSFEELDLDLEAPLEGNRGSPSASRSSQYTSTSNFDNPPSTALSNDSSYSYPSSLAPSSASPKSGAQQSDGASFVHVQSPSTPSSFALQQDSEPRPDSTPRTAAIRKRTSAPNIAMYTTSWSMSTSALDDASAAKGRRSSGTDGQDNVEVKVEDWRISREGSGPGSGLVFQCNLKHKRRSSSVETGRWSGMSRSSGYTPFVDPHTMTHRPWPLPLPLRLDLSPHTRTHPSGPSSPITPITPNLTLHQINHSPNREKADETKFATQSMHAEREESSTSTILAPAIITSTKEIDGEEGEPQPATRPSDTIVPESDVHVSALALSGSHLAFIEDNSPTVRTFNDSSVTTTTTNTSTSVEPHSSNSSILTTPSSPSSLKGGTFESFPTPPPREARTTPNSTSVSPSGRPSLLPPLPIALLSTSPPPPLKVKNKELPMPLSLDDHGHWISPSTRGNLYSTTPPAFALQKTPSLPFSSSRTPSDGSGIPIDTPPSSGFISHSGSRRLSKFTAFSGSSGASASSLYSSDTDSLRDRERHYRVTEHPDISTVFEEGTSFEIDREREREREQRSQAPIRKQSQSTLINNTSSQRTHHRAGTISSNNSGRSNTSVHPFAAVIHRAPSPPSSNPILSARATSPHLSTSRSQQSIAEVARMHLKPAHQVTLAEEGDTDDEEKCPICVESLGFSYRLPGEKPHVVPECGHALHEECFVTVYGEVPIHGSKRNIGLCGVCRQKMRIVEGGGERKRSKGKKLDMLMGASSMTPPTLHDSPSFPSLSSMSPTAVDDPYGDDPVDVVPSNSSSKSFISDPQTRVVVPTITIKSEFPSTTRRTSKPTTAMITIEVPHAPERARYPASRTLDSLRSPSGTLNSPRQPASPGSFASNDFGLGSTFSSPSGPANPFANVEAELKHRVIDYKNSGLDSLGPLRLYDLLAIRKGSMLREFLMYLYNDALICISEEKPNAFQKIFSSGSSMRSNDTKSSVGTGSGRGALKLRGRIYIKHVKKLVDSSVPQELSITILMENEGMESFILTFKDKGSHEMWRSTLQQIIDEAKSVSTAGKGGNNAHKIAKLMGSGAPSPATRNGKTPATPGMTTSSSMGFAPSMSDFETPDSPSGFSSRGPSPGDLVNNPPLAPVHTPIDLVIVLSLPPTPPGVKPPLKLRLMRQSLTFVFALMGSKDRVSIVSCEMGTSIRRTPLLNPTKYESRRRLEEFVDGIGAGPISDDETIVQTQPDERHDVVTAMNVSLDVILQRKVKNPLTGLILLSDTADVTKRAQMDLVCARLDAANVPVHSLGYGKSHDPTPLWMISNHTQGTYTFVREWYHLRDTLAGVIGGLMTIALTNMKLHLSAQENEFRIVRVTGTPQAIGSSTGRTLDIELKELRYGEKRDILVEVELIGDGSARNSNDSGSGSRPGPGSSVRRSPSSLANGLDSMSMSIGDSSSVLRDMVYEEGMVDEVPVVEVDCSFHDPAVGRSVSRLAHPVLLTLAILPSTAAMGNPTSDPSVQRRKMELIASDMLTRSLLLVSRRNFVQAHKLLSETRRIVRTIAEGMRVIGGEGRTRKEISAVQAVEQLDNIVGDMDSLCEALDENPELFGRDQRNFASQQGIVLRSQRSWTMRTGSEHWYCTEDVRRIIQISGEWGVKSS